MFCHSCGKPLNDDAEFCSYCGVRVKITEVERQTSQTQEENLQYAIEENTPIKNFVKKFFGFVKKIMWYFIILLSMAFGKMIAQSPSDPNFQRKMEYILPSLIFGLIGGIVCICIESKIENLNHSTTIKIFSFILCLALGIIGGITFVIGGGIIILLITFVISKL